jgi:tape measure domain-containing protein
MASPLEEIKIALKVTDANASAVVKKLESSFRGLANASKQLDAQGISKVRDRIKAFDTAGKRNINTIQSQISALRALRNEAQIGSGQFKQLTADIARYDQELQKAQGRRKGGGRLVGAAKSVGAIAAAGVFGGPEGAIGAGIGALAGGPVGAAVGGAIGAQVGQVRQALGATAEYAANLQKLRIALEGVTTSQEEYSQGLNFIQQTTKDFAIPQEVVTRQFTKLQASVQGAGGNLDDTKTAFNGIVAAVRATGGSLADVDAALTATAQVFSKGKVSAEELRQQIGERLPGAFTLFAESMGITPAELDKAL